MAVADVVQEQVVDVLRLALQVAVLVALVVQAALEADFYVQPQEK
jgi:hypothetical protein